MRSSSVEEVGGHGPGDPWEVFTALAILVVEGRTPGGERGYHAGPHCPLPHQLLHKHSCDNNDHTCVAAGALVRQLRVMWGVGVGVTLEVLVAPECEHGAALATTLDTTTAPSHNLKLIEQWNFTIYDRRLPEASANGWSLMAAVRSFLHFSQLSAWLSVSGGRRPPNVLYRLAVTSPVFCSKFTQEAEQHVFPLTYMGQDTSIRVAVRSLPRSEKVPVVMCPELHDEDQSADVTMADQLGPSCSQNRTEIGRCDEDLRRSVMKAKLAENTRVSRSESPDTQLGESLLDPPHSLTRFPRRYQSPSRSGSPSLETPEHLICRHRPPAPQHNKPPDISLMVGPAPTSHPFSWTQARYPLTPIPPPATLDNICSSSAEALHHQQLQQNPYRFDFPSSYQELRRPQLVYNRPQMCWPQVQPVIHQKPQHISLHTQQTPLSLNPCNYEGQQKPGVPVQVSPRGGKYQHYPEYQVPDYREPHLPLGEYAEPAAVFKDHKCSEDFSEPGSSWMSKGRERNLSSSASESFREHGLKRPGEYPIDEEYYHEFQTCKRDFFQKHLAAFEPSLGSSDVRSEQCSTRLKQYVAKQSEQTQEEMELPPVLDDELRPCCSYTGKHLCSSLEDLTEICSQDDAKLQLHSKDLKHELKQRGSVSPSHLFRNKFNFELTPKETMEILRVLRQPTPVPPLRMDRHRSQPETESRSQREVKSLVENSSLSKSWGEKECDKFFRDRGVDFDARFWREDTSEALYRSRREILQASQRDRNWDERLDTPCADCKDIWDSKASTLFGCQEQKSDRCHSDLLGRGLVQELPSSPENLFLKAINRSGEKQCDISRCKTLINSDEGYRTRNCNDIKSDTIDRKNPNTFSESDRYVTKDTSQHSTGRCVTKDTSQYCAASGSSQSQCVEAKKITLKTSIFTASSEPAKPDTSQPQKQTSQTLVKSPLRSVMSCIQKEYHRVLSDERDHYHAFGQLKPVLLEGKEMVKRALNFENLRSSDNSSTKTEKLVAKSNQVKEKVADVSEQAFKKFSVRNVERVVHDAPEGFIKSSSLLKHLMTKVHCQTQDITQDKKQRRVLGVETDWSEIEDASQMEHDGSQEIEPQEDLECMDDEVEKICNGKGVPIPSASEKAQFRRSLDSATNMVFHSKTGLPLTSSPAPLRKGKRFDYDSSLTCVAAIKRTCLCTTPITGHVTQEPEFINTLQRSTSFHCSALYTCDSEEDEDGYGLELVSNTTTTATTRTTQLSTSAPATVTCSNLLGSFEECVLNGRLEPVSTVHGFTAEIAASGAFCPKRTTKPVTVFFYTLCDNDQISSPYMGHINLGKKGYHVPNKGTAQVTLFNPHGTVVKMFVVMYDLSDMPANSRTFVRQRTLNMPVGASDTDPNAHQWLRYLIHLRFVSSKSGKIYLHTDIRMLIFRKSDADAATLHKTNVPYELRSFTHGPTNPKFSPRK